MSEFVFEPRSIEDSHTLTMLIRKGVHEDTTLAEKIMPLRSTSKRRIKIKTREFDPSALGQFKATNANTPIRTGGGTVETTYQELVDLEEKEVLSQQDILDLASIDDRVQLEAARNVAEVVMELRQRNRQLTNWMRWKALQDELTITYHDGTAIAIDFDLNNTDARMKTNHVKDVHSSAPWNNAASDIIGTMQTWLDELSNDAGVNGASLIVNQATWRHMQKNTVIKGFLSESYGALKIPSLKAVASMFWDIDPDNPENGQILVEDKFYRDAADARQYFVPDGYALLTTPWVVDNEPIAVMFDGPVVKVQGNDLVVSNNPGAEAEMYIDAEAKRKNIRVATARMPWMRRECFIWARVY